MKRLFAAVKIHPEKDFLDQFHRLQSLLQREKIKWVEDHNIHITLKFFGETEENRIPEITNVLHSVATSTHPFEISLQKLGIFGSSYNPKVIWIGIHPYAELAETMRRLQTGLKLTGYEPDRQNLVPHLTLGRIKYLSDRSYFQQTIDEYKNISSVSQQVNSFHLFESILKREGPVYISLKEFNFQK